MNAPLPAAQVRERLYRDMDSYNLTPLWEVLHALVPPRPNTPPSSIRRRRLPRRPTPSRSTTTAMTPRNTSPPERGLTKQRPGSTVRGVVVS